MLLCLYAHKESSLCPVGEFLLTNTLQKEGFDLVGAVSLKLIFWHGTVLFFSLECQIFGNNVLVTLFQKNLVAFVLSPSCIFIFCLIHSPAFSCSWV